jgi:TolA-binding protein
MRLKNSLKNGLFFCAIGLLIIPSLAISQDFFSKKDDQKAAQTAASRALVRLDELEGHLRTLTDRIERLEAQNNALNAENQRLARLIDENRALVDKTDEPAIITKDNTNSAITTQEAAKPTISAPAPAPAPAVAVSAPINAPISAPISAPAIVAKPVTTASVATSKVAPTNSTPKTKPADIIAPVKPPPELYLSKARLNIQNGDLDIAADNLKSLIKDYPNSSDAMEARWLLGETYFVEKEWLDATKIYIEYLNKDSKAPRVPDILIRLASTYREMGVPDQRCKALNSYKSVVKSPSAILKARADDEFSKGTCP